MTSTPRDSAPPLGVWPAPKSARRVLLFGGTFDPPHRGHIEIPPIVRDEQGFDWLVYIPARRSPHKADQPVASDQQRIEMLCGALRGVEHVGISTIETESDTPGPSFTVDTLRRLREIVGPDVELRLLIGADQAQSFDAWREPDEIKRIAPPIVMRRPGVEPAPGSWWQGSVIEAPLLEISATEIRRLLAAADDHDPALDSMLPPAVLEVIRREGLYRAPSGD